MNKEELKDIVKKYFNLTEQNETLVDTQVKETFTEATLADGTKITNMVDADFEVGQELHVITEENAHVLAPSGEHTTESGIVITVDGEGKITGVKHPDAEGEGSLEEEAAPVSEEMSTEEVEMAEHPEDEVVEEAMEDMDIKEVIVEAIAEVVAPELEMLKKKMADMEEKMKKHYAAEPAAKSSLESKFSKSNNDPLSFLDNKFNRNKARYEAIVNKK